MLFLSKSQIHHPGYFQADMEVHCDRECPEKRTVETFLKFDFIQLVSWTERKVNRKGICDWPWGSNITRWMFEPFSSAILRATYRKHSAEMNILYSYWYRWIHFFDLFDFWQRLVVTKNTRKTHTGIKQCSLNENFKLCCFIISQWAVKKVHVL